MKVVIFHDIIDLNQITKIVGKLKTAKQNYRVFCFAQDVYDAIDDDNKILTDFVIDIAKNIGFSDTIESLIDDIYEDVMSLNKSFVYQSVKLIELERYIHHFSYSIFFHYLLVYDWISENCPIEEFIIINGPKGIHTDQWWQKFTYRAPMFAAEVVGREKNIKLTIENSEYTLNKSIKLKGYLENLLSWYLIKPIGETLGFVFNLFNTKSSHPTILICNAGALITEVNYKHKYSLILGEEEERYHRGVLTVLKTVFKSARNTKVFKLLKFKDKNSNQSIRFETTNDHLLKGYQINDYINEWQNFVIAERFSSYVGIIDKTNRTLKEYDIRGVIAHNTSLGFPNIVFAAVKDKIPTFEILHGIASIKQAFVPARPSFTLCMGQHEKEFTNLDNFIPLGSDKFLNIHYNNFEQTDILYVSCRNEKRYGSAFLTKGFMDYEIANLLKIISKGLKAHKDYNLLIKYAPGQELYQCTQHSRFAKRYLDLKYTILDKTSKMVDHFPRSFCMITYDSTAALEAMSGNIPVIFLNAKTGYYKKLDKKNELFFAETADDLDRFLNTLKNRISYDHYLSLQHRILKENFGLSRENLDGIDPLTEFINRKLK